MYFVEYISMDQYSWFDTGLIPDIYTKIELDITMPSSVSADWRGFIGAQNSDDHPSTFQIRRYNRSNQFSARVGDGVDANAGPGYTANTRYTLTLDKDYFVCNGTSNAVGTTMMDTCNYTLYINGIHKPSFAGSQYRSAGGKYHRIKVWENGILVGDFRPAVDNDVVGFYDSVNSSFKTNLGTGTVTAGPIDSSIFVSATKTILAASGETINIEVSTQNAWTLSSSGDTFLTFSSTGDTSGATITATAPSYSGSTPREEHIIFTDTSTNDTADLTIKQKKYTNGQPFYLGSDEVMECFLGDSAVTEAYLGEDLVYSSSPAPTPTGGSVNIIISGATSACIGDDGGGCKPYSSITFTLHNDGEGEDSAFAIIENTAYMPDSSEVMWELVDSGITAEVDTITYDDTTDTLTFIGEFDTGSTHYVRCMATELNERYLYMGEAVDEIYGTTFDGSTSVTLSPDLSVEYDPLRTLIITGVTFPSDEGETLAISDNDKFNIEMTWNTSEMTYDTSNSWLSEDWFSFDFDDTEGEVRITADWGLYSDGGEYTVDSKFETMGQCIDPTQQSLLWDDDDEFEKTMTFGAGAPCAEE